MSGNNGTAPKNSELVKQYLEYGFDQSNCESCVWRREFKGSVRISCGAPIAVSIKAIADEVRKQKGANENTPLFPLIALNIEGNDISIAGVIPDENAVIADRLKWPEYFDPQDILLCVLYSDHIDGEENPPTQTND